MKKIFIFLVLSIISSNAYTQYKWSDLTYHYQTGSIPPPYYYEYDILISAFGDLTLLYSPDYSVGILDQWKYELKLTESQIISLDSEVKNSKVLDAEIGFLPPDKTPIGGSLDNLKITLYQDPTLDQRPTVIDTPYFPTDPEQKKALDKLYESIRTLVPENIWNELKQKKDEHINKNIK